MSRQAGPRAVLCFHRCCFGGKRRESHVKANNDAIILNEITSKLTYYFDSFSNIVFVSSSVSGRIFDLFQNNVCRWDKRTWKRGSKRKQSHSIAEVRWRNQRAQFRVFFLHSFRVQSIGRFFFYPAKQAPSGKFVHLKSEQMLEVWQLYVRRSLTWTLICDACRFYGALK